MSTQNRPLIHRVDLLTHRREFADPFPPEYAGREQVELVLDRVTDLRLDVANLRACLVGIIGDQFAGLNARLAALEAK